MTTFYCQIPCLGLGVDFTFAQEQEQQEQEEEPPSKLINKHLKEEHHVKSRPSKASQTNHNITKPWQKQKL